MRAKLPPILSLFLIIGLAACAERGVPRTEGTTQGIAAPAKVAPPPALGTDADSDVRPSPPAPAGEAEQPARRGPNEEDVADCYRYARATVEHDRGIERDRGGSVGFGSLGSDVGTLSRQLTTIGEDSTFDRAYSSCIRSKGYDQE